MSYRLLEAFEATFRGRRYLHRNSSLGDLIAVELYEDLLEVGRSRTYCQRVERRGRVVNTKNVRRGIKARRGDGTFGELIPNASSDEAEGFGVARGPVATVEIGVEVKILAKALIKQIDRVIGDLAKQTQHFRRGGGDPICVGIVGVNHAESCCSYEGDRVFQTDGKKHKHPAQEAAQAEERLVAEAKPSFDEFLLLSYRATNVDPYPFKWVDIEGCRLDYGAILTRISRAYDRRFRNGNGAA